MTEANLQWHGTLEVDIIDGTNFVKGLVCKYMSETSIKLWSIM